MVVVPVPDPPSAKLAAETGIETEADPPADDRDPEAGEEPKPDPS